MVWDFFSGVLCDNVEMAKPDIRFGKDTTHTIYDKISFFGFGIKRNSTKNVLRVGGNIRKKEIFVCI